MTTAKNIANLVVGLVGEMGEVPFAFFEQGQVQPRLAIVAFDP